MSLPHRKEFDTTLKVRLDTLRAELTREKDAAILSLKQAQDSQLEELKEYYTSRYASKVSEMQKLIDAKDAKIEELEAALGEDLGCRCASMARVTGQEKEESRPVRSRRRRSRRRSVLRLSCRRAVWLVSRYLQREGPEAGRRPRGDGSTAVRFADSVPIPPADARRRARAARSAPCPRASFTASRRSPSLAPFLVERFRIYPAHPERDIMALTKNAPRHGIYFAQQ